MNRRNDPLRSHLLGSTYRFLLGSVIFLGLGTWASAQAPKGGEYPPGDTYDEEMSEEDSGGEYPGDDGYDGSGDPGGDYGSDSGYGSGGPRGRRPGSGSAGRAMMESQRAAMTSIFGTLDLASLMAPASDFPPVSTGPVLSGDAEHAYRNGNYPLALELYFGHMVTEYDQARVSLQTVKYSRLLRRPVWQVRWGVSYTLRGAIDESDPQPIIEGKTPLNRVANNRGRNTGPGSFDEGAYEDDMEDDMETSSPDTSGENMYGSEDPGGGGRRRSSKPSQPQRDMLSADAKEQLITYLGLVETVMAEKFASRYSQGDFGLALTAVMVPEPVDPRQRPDPNDEPAFNPSMGPISQEAIDLLDDSAEPYLLWQPGFQYLGEGESTEMVEIARNVHIDVLVHFDIFLKAGREKWVQNVSRARIVNVATGKPLVISKGIDSFEAIQLARTGRKTEREYVEEQLDSLFAVIDRDVKTMDLPPLTPEVAKRRVGALLSGPNSKSLRTLAEIRLYQTQELLTSEEVEAAFDIAGGSEALLMLHGPLEQRLETVRKWALKAVPEASQ